MRLSEMEIENIADRTKAMLPEEKEVTLHNLSSRSMMEEIERRGDLIMEILTQVVNIWNDLEIDLIALSSAPITEKEYVLRELRGAINGKL